MAGIGFQLSKLLNSSDVTSKIKGATASVFLSSGPWLCTILSIAIISLVMRDRIDIVEQQLFRIIINYTYVVSLIGFGLIEMATTRYVADVLYLSQEKIIPTLFAGLSCGILGIFAVGGAIAVASLGKVGWYFLYISGGFAIFIVIFALWITSVRAR